MQGILGLVDHLVDLVLRVVDLFFGLTSAPIGLAFGFEVLVAGQDSSGLLGVALQLIRLGAHRAPPFSSCTPNPGPGVSGLARGHSPLARGHSPPGPRIPRSDEPTHRTMVPGWIGTIRGTAKISLKPAVGSVSPGQRECLRIERGDSHVGGPELQRRLVL